MTDLFLSAFKYKSEKLKYVFIIVKMKSMHNCFTIHIFFISFLKTLSTPFSCSVTSITQIPGPDIVRQALEYFTC